MYFSFWENKPLKQSILHGQSKQKNIVSLSQQCVQLLKKTYSALNESSLYFCLPDTSQGNQCMKFVCNMTANSILASDLTQWLKQPGRFYTGSLQAHRPGNIMPNQHQRGRLWAMLWGSDHQLHSISFSDVKKVRIKQTLMINY